MTTTPSRTTRSRSLGDGVVQVSSAERERVARALRIGRISFLNVFPMHFALGVDPVFSGAPTELNRRIVDGSIDVACMSSIEYARNADQLVLLPSMCIAADGAVGSIFAISSRPLEQVGRIHATPASATSVVLVQLLCALRGSRPEVIGLDGDVASVLDADPDAAVLLIGDEALQARGNKSLSHLTFTDLGERWLAETGLPMVYAVWAVRRDVAEQQPEVLDLLDRMLVESVRAFSVSPDAIPAAAREYDLDEHVVSTYFSRLCYAFGQRERQGLMRYLRMASEQGLLDRVPSPRFAIATDEDPVDPLSGNVVESTEEARTRAREDYLSWVGTRQALTERAEDAAELQRALDLEEAARNIDVDDVLQRALDDERIDDADAVALLQSRRLVEVGQVAHQLRLRRTPADVVTFIVDRNINYTNICVTDCGFCAFFRRPGEGHDSYVHSTEEILHKVRETVDLGGTAALMQGGHNPDLGIEWYVDLFRAIKAEFPTFHLHALSPPEIQHIARRSKMAIADVLSELRDAGLDSLPGGGGEVLIDRVRRIIAPKKTKSDDWLGVMREAQRMGMSTTASLMYGHAELLAERVLHMARIREVQDQHGGFRAFISWTFQPGSTPLGRLLELGAVPHQELLPPTPTPFDYLLTQAVSRIYLDNIENIQSSWVTQGMKVGQVALYHGANDMGSIMIEENVVSSAGTTYRATTEDFVNAIRATGMRPVQRDTLYRTVREH